MKIRTADWCGDEIFSHSRLVLSRHISIQMIDQYRERTRRCDCVNLLIRQHRKETSRQFLSSLRRDQLSFFLCSAASNRQQLYRERRRRRRKSSKSAFEARQQEKPVE
jgi:hypothetical protein